MEGVVREEHYAAPPSILRQPHVVIAGLFAYAERVACLRPFEERRARMQDLAVFGRHAGATNGVLDRQIPADLVRETLELDDGRPVQRLGLSTTVVAGKGCVGWGG